MLPGGASSFPGDSVMLDSFPELGPPDLSPGPAAWAS